MFFYGETFMINMQYKCITNLKIKNMNPDLNLNQIETSSFGNAFENNETSFINGNTVDSGGTSEGFSIDSVF